MDIFKKKCRDPVVWILESVSNGADVIVTLDDDCFPTDDDLLPDILTIFPTKHQRLDECVSRSKASLYQGFPYKIREK